MTKFHSRGTSGDVMPASGLLGSGRSEYDKDQQRLIACCCRHRQFKCFRHEDAVPSTKTDMLVGITTVLLRVHYPLLIKTRLTDHWFAWTTKSPAFMNFTGLKHPYSKHIYKTKKANPKLTPFLLLTKSLPPLLNHVREHSVGTCISKLASNYTLTEQIHTRHIQRQQKVEHWREHRTNLPHWPNTLIHQPPLRANPHRI